MGVSLTGSRHPKRGFWFGTDHRYLFPGCIGFIWYLTGR
ncbi:hypothetical protein HDF15_003472 [Granulicella mallensis]|uniref:Uncharacterized protein n=1 Tax=Granulicella mallensis TaxID=940614 RepID=A0A7W7ZS37_9BACT|nr:hypothetical protein [Granulicella mallensis]